MDIEKRKRPRFACRRPKGYPLDFKDRKLNGCLLDFSRNGISLRVSTPLEQNKAYQFEIWVAALEKPVSCEAHVLWSRHEAHTGHYIVGARILQMDPSSKIDLLDVLYQGWKQRTLSNL